MTTGKDIGRPRMSDEERGVDAVDATPQLACTTWTVLSDLVSLGGARYELRQAFPITVELLPDQVIVSDEHVNMYGAGSNLKLALQEYQAAFITYFEWLQANEATLAADLPEHLAWYRTHLAAQECGHAGGPG